MTLVPTRAEFHALAQTGRLVPVYREVFADHDTPVSAFRKIDNGPYAFPLASVAGGEKGGRYGILGSRPAQVVVARGVKAELQQGVKVTALKGRPLEEVAQLLKDHQ